MRLGVCARVHVRLSVSAWRVPLPSWIKIPGCTPLPVRNITITPAWRSSWSTEIAEAMVSSQGGPSGSTKVSFGFKKTALPSQTGAANPLLASKPKPPAFSSLEGDDNDDEEQVDGAAASSSSSSAFSRPQKKTSNAPTGLAHSAPASKVSRQKAAEAEQLDSSVYDYDGVFDSLKSVQRSQAEARQAERAKRDPKYIEGMLDSVKERNKLLLRAQAKKIEREREAEGEEFREGEEFVTDAYREQQEELRKVEEAEKAEEGEWAAQGLCLWRQGLTH